MVVCRQDLGAVREVVGKRAFLEQRDSHARHREEELPEQKVGLDVLGLGIVVVSGSEWHQEVDAEVDCRRKGLVAVAGGVLDDGVGHMHHFERMGRLHQH